MDLFIYAVSTNKACVSASFHPFKWTSSHPLSDFDTYSLGWRSFKGLAVPWLRLLAHDMKVMHSVPGLAWQFLKPVCVSGACIIDKLLLQKVWVFCNLSKVNPHLSPGDWRICLFVYKSSSLALINEMLPSVGLLLPSMFPQAFSGSNMWT